MNKVSLVISRVVYVCRLLFILVVIVISSSCAPFQHTVENPTRLQKQTIAKLNGTYHFRSQFIDSLHGEGRGWRYNQNFFNELDRKLLKDTLVLDSTGQYAFQLTMENSKRMQVNFIKDDTIFCKRSFKTKLTKDGYIKLKNKNFQVVLLPYVLGFIDVKRVRFTVDADRNLVFDVGEHRSGGAFIVMFDGRNYKYRRTYNRISDN